MPSLYACLRSPRTPDVAVAVAKEFSPRLQRYGCDCVVLDVGGLGRLLGEPPTIGAELASRIAELSRGTQIRGYVSRDADLADPGTSDAIRISPIR